MAHIVIAEDDDNLRQALSRCVTFMGHRVSEARDGRECLAIHRADPADVVITDIVMPESDGLALISELRRRSSTVGIIAISGGGLVPAREYLRIAKGMGAAALLEKPFVNQQLTLVLEELLQTKAQPAG